MDFTEELINGLAKVSGLKVIGTVLDLSVKGKNEDLREVGRKLGVANVLEEVCAARQPGAHHCGLIETTMVFSFGRDVRPGD